MHLTIPLIMLIGAAAGKYHTPCKDFVETMDIYPSKFYSEQPLFITTIPKTKETDLLDNICLTYFPLPDDPETFHIYLSRVFCDGSNDIKTLFEAPFGPGITRKATVDWTVQDHYIAYAGCDTYILYRCHVGGLNFEPYVYGVSSVPKPVPLSCLKKFEEIIVKNNLPEVHMKVLPMKLPNRCVTQQLCTAPTNPFYNKPYDFGLDLF